MWRKNCRCLGIVLLAIFYLFLISGVSAIRINEVMYNPVQNDNYNEWIEIYNNEAIEINLSIIKLCNDNLLAGYINKNDEEVYLNTTLTLGPNSYAVITDGGSGTEAYINFNISDNSLSIRTSSSSLCGVLTNSGKTIKIINYNNEILDLMSYSSSLGANGNGKSLQYCNGLWIEADPTPGTENLCQQNQQNQSQQNNSENQQNNQNQNTNQNIQENKISISLEYDEEIENGEDFEVEVKTYNLKSEKYDIKMSIEDENNLISETYNEESEKWQSSNYYINEIINGPGNKSKTLKLRIKDNYKDFSGDAEIKAKIRKTGTTSIITEFSGNIEILEKEENNEDDNETNLEEKVKEEKEKIKENENIEEENKVIVLNTQEKKDIKTKQTYLSEKEKIKKYAIYGFIFLCIVFIILLLKINWKKRRK